jgi:KDO2-lipid IV(A) lauroyltransferase
MALRPVTALYWALRGATAIARIVPVRVSYALARLSGTLVYYVWAGGRRRSIGNMLHVARGNAALARRYARRSFAYYGTYLIDFLRFGGITAAEIGQSIAFDDWPRVEGERTGNGIVFVTMHFGNWDLAGAVLAGRMPITVVADTFDHDGINDIVVGARQRLGMSIVPAERMGPGILRALRSNNVVALLADIPYPNGVHVDFFGATVAVPDGPARIALRAGAPIMVGGVWRSGPSSNRYDADVERVDFAPSGSTEADVRGLTQAMMTALERLVLRAPDQWYIFRSLWLDDVGDLAS